MTIEKGEDWGSRVGPDDVVNLRTASNDHDVAENPGGTLLGGGDLGLTLGITGCAGDAALWQRLPLDLLHVSYVDRRGRLHDTTAAAWVTTGSFLSGPFFVVANTSFVKGRRLFPRSHPNDGRFEILEVSTEMSRRQRLVALRRVRSDTHLPHPHLTTRSATSFHFAWPAPKKIVVDGFKLGYVREITVEIRPNAGITHVAV
jgi:hypothetical protein